MYNVYFMALKRLYKNEISIYMLSYRTDDIQRLALMLKKVLHINELIHFKIIYDSVWYWYRKMHSSVYYILDPGLTVH